MAVTPPSNDAFFREVDDELRRDKTEEFFRRYGKLLIAGVALLLVVAGGWLWWQNAKKERAGLNGEAMAQALADVAGGNVSEPKGRAALEKLAQDGNGGYRVTARLALADAMVAAGDVKAGAAAFGAIADDDDAPQPFRDLARVRQTAAEYDTLPPGTVRARLQNLAVPGNPWFGSAGEMVALAWLKEGNRAQAGQVFAKVGKDPGVPQTLRSRAVQMAGILGVDAVAQDAPATSGGTNGK